jgi:phosphoenolpyruvate phosphomutase
MKMRALLNSPTTSFLMEAHDGLSARIVRDAGFAGIWASGLAISTASGVRDVNELSWSQVLGTLEFMTDCVDVPILVDADTGYGNFNNARKFVTRAERLGIGGICLEDKQFPKRNSFIAGGQELCDVDEFCGKLKACKDAQRSDDFCVVARVEAMIAGYGMAEALTRAEAYRQAGADAVLIHSKRSSSEEILTFASEWANRAPLVVVPTTYYRTPTQAFREAGISVVIWANHNIRASMRAMQDVTTRIFRNESVADIEDDVVPVAEIFRAYDYAALDRDEERYVPPPRLRTMEES